MEKKIIIVNGKPRSGKDTFESFAGMYIPSAKYSAISCVKKIAKEYCNWDESMKEPRDRCFLSQLKDLLAGYADAPFRSIHNTIERFLGHDQTHWLLFIDTRELEEVKRIKMLYPQQTAAVFIDRPNDEKYGNHADDNARFVSGVYDFRIFNSGTITDLRGTTEKWLHEVMPRWFDERPFPAFSLEVWE